MSNRYPLSVITALLLCLGILSMPVPGSAEALPEIILPVPENQQDRDYLGLEKEPGETFSLAEVETDILLIELFSMYCPYCQEEAPHVNTFYEMAGKLEDEENITVKVVGLGASNTPFEVQYFREQYTIPFPLFADKPMTFYKKLEGEGTPGFIGVRMREQGEPEIVLRRTGGFETVEGFLDELLREAGYR